MGCVSSKLFAKDLKREFLLANGSSTTHVVSLTSSTYGVLKLENEHPIRESAITISKRSPPREAVAPPEVINAWELMKDLDDEIPTSIQAKKSPKSRPSLETRSPLKFLNHMSSPKKSKRGSGKENKPGIYESAGRAGRLDYSPKGVLRAFSGSENPKRTPVLSLRSGVKGSPMSVQSDCSRTSFEFIARRRSLSPMFDPDLVASFERELSEEEEQIKTMVVSSVSKRRSSKSSKDCESLLRVFEEKCPPGGENSVVIYTTTLRGIRKTFEDCNVVRTIIESNCVSMFERDISMDSGFKEELRRLMGTKGVKVPLVFVKGRMLGGADEMIKLEEEGKLGILFEGIPRAAVGCEGCAGVRFVMCMDCNGSCKVLDVDQNKTVRCGECNENGLIQCPVCCMMI